ncbi:KR domain-containing protein [Pseudoalteromonas rubra]|uniref:Uncharacterized protein n=1 Tax=Pseudoalteromonas rubra TaxID=43658 RepID=A0A0U3I518_9GAMM|nr:KR domain-containing protein [Pseudoalteromonas rubra]ALU42991.1 hypothetical protein AT705_08555 [Pseudoalteromonas rubra]
MIHTLSGDTNPNQFPAISAQQLGTASFRADYDVKYAYVSGCMYRGTASQCDYGTANAFLDRYMQQRHIRIARGERHGLSASIDWLFWQEGDMQHSAQFTHTDTAMPTNNGINVFYQALQQPQSPYYRLMWRYADRKD